MRKLLVLLIAILASNGGQAQDVIAHRGASDLAPEETMPAFQRAIDFNARYLELDIQRSKDGVIVAFHDDDLTRTTDVEKVFPEWAGKRPRIADFTYEQLMRLDAGSWFNQTNPGKALDAYVGAKIVTLEQVLELAAREMKHPSVYVEFKNSNWYPNIENEAIEILKRTGWLEDNGQHKPNRELVFQSFEIESLNRLKTLAPDVQRTYLIWDPEGYGKPSNWSNPTTWRNLLRAAAEAGHHVIGPDYPLAFVPGFNELRKSLGLKLHVWTVNDMELVPKLAPIVDAIFTDKAQEPVLRTLKPSPQRAMIRSCRGAAAR